MQYILNMAFNAKILEGLVHKLWEDFEKLAFVNFASLELVAL